MENVHLAIPEEIALEGLDGITFDTLWFRLSERLNFPLPLNEKIQNDIWQAITDRDCYEYFEISADRATPQKMDRRDYFFNTDISNETITAIMKASYYIYSYSPIDDPNVRGSCSEFKTRKKLSLDYVKSKSLEEIYKKYNQRFVIVGSQKLRESVLIPKNLGRECDINNIVYCFLERIGRSRYFGEATSGVFSLMDFVKDSKLLHYFRNSLLKNKLVMRQHLQAKIRGHSFAGQLFHLPRFHIVVRASNMLMTEQLFDFLEKQPNHMAETEEAKSLLNIKQKNFVSFIRSRSAVFRYNIKTPYRDCYPDATKEQYTLKKKGEKTITTVSLVNPELDISTLWHQEDEDTEDINEGFLEVSKQLINRPLIHQVYKKIEESGKEGLSQLEIAKYFGLSRLNARSVLRKVQKQRNIDFYMKDEGRQRVSKFVTKDAAKDASQQIVAEMAKLLKKADEAVISQEETISTLQEQSSTKVSIPLTSIVNGPIKIETLCDQPAIQYILSEPSSSHVFAKPEPVDQQAVKIIVQDDETSFIDNVEDVSVSMRFLNNIPNMKQSQGIAQDISQNRISGKVLTRMNKILDFVKSRTIVDSVNLLHLMRQEEVNLPELICRKSMFSLCGKLATDNLLKVIEMELKSSSKSVKLLFFGVINVSFDMKCWNSIIEEQKLQHFISNKPNDLSSMKLSMSSMSFLSKSSVASEEFGAQSKRYENFPKFMKFKLFHEFMFYLIYSYPIDNKKIPIRKAMETWCRDNPKILDHADITESITFCYSTDISWKMFVPPLNKQREYENGWALLRDVIHRLPLILFVKLSRLGQESPELKDFLMHPIKCNYLLHFLPPSLRDTLLCGRKYVFVIQELCKKLCYCGLLQFGPQRSKEVDQTFVYLNRNASLIDTSTSEPGYMEVSEKDYEKIQYTFDTPDVVYNYWNQMFEICCNTRINRKSLAIGKTVEIEQIHSKQILMDTLKVQTPISAPLNDTGEIPGDRKGAAGLDKAFLAHLKRNWTRSLESGKRKFRAVKPISAKLKREKSSVVKEAAARIRNKTISSAQSRFKPKIIKTGVTEKSKIIRKIAPVRRAKKRTQVTEDTVDKEALKRMNAIRVSWTEAEDKTLLLAKVALKFAFPQDAQSSHYISMIVIRDILHWAHEKAMNKTSKAVARRLGNLIKIKSVREQIALYLEVLRSNKDFSIKYQNLVVRLKRIYPLSDVYDAMQIHVVEMVHRMHQIIYKQYLGNEGVSEVRTIIELPNDFRERYTITNPANTLVDRKYADPRTPNDAEVSMLMSLVHSIVCCNKEKVSYRYYNFEVLKKFADTQVSAAVSQIRRATVISDNKKDRGKDNDMFSSYHLTTRYGIQMMGVHVPVELYDEYFQALKTLSKSEEPHQMTSINCGWIFMLAEMVSTGKIQLKYDRAEKLVMVDPSLRKKTNFDKISDEYLKLHEEKLVKKTVQMQVGEGIDDTFLFIDDPVEIFLKIRIEYLHAFCIIKELLNSNSVKVTADGECHIEGCVLSGDDNFSEEIRRISCKGKELVRQILTNPASKAFNSTTNIVNKENFISYFNEMCETDEKNLKDFSTKSMRKWKRLSATSLLEAIMTLSTETGLEADTWLSEYKKMSRITEEEDQIEDEELDPIKHSKMLNQLRDLNLNSRTSDSFVVNLSTIYVDKKCENGEKLTFQDSEFDSRLLPFSEADRAAFIEKILFDFKWKPEDLLARDLFDELSSAGITNTIEIMKISEICNFLQAKCQMGATAAEMLAVYVDKQQLEEQITKLISMKLVLRIGVNETRFIHRDFVAFWLIDTFLTTRDEPEVQEPPEKKARTEDEPEAPKKPAVVRHQMRIRPAPWIRVNGTLNRRVLDKWLGTLLNHLTISPCMMLSALSDKFNVLKPFEVRNLCEILEMIGSVRLMTIQEAEADFFSSYTGTTIEPATIFCSNDEIYIELTDDAMQRLTFFIGRKKYKTPFI